MANKSANAGCGTGAASRADDGRNAVVVEFGKTYRADVYPEPVVIRYFFIAETKKAIGILPVHKWKKLPRKVAPFVYETEGGQRLIEFGRYDGEGFLCADPHILQWLPKSQIQYDNDKVIIPQWLAKKNGFDLLEEVVQ